MSSGSDARQQRVIAVSLLAAVLMIGIAAIAIPVWSVNTSYNDSIRQMQQRLVRLQQLAASDKELRPRYEQIKAAQQSAGNYLQSSTEAVAAAELQGILKRISAANGTQVLSTQILPAGQEAQFVRVSLRARLRGPLSGIFDTFYAIETNKVLLFLDGVSLHNTADRRRAMHTTGAQFEVDLDLITYMAAAQ